MIISFSQLLLNWYKKHARLLPWRGVSDPYATWISEIMLQQTRVETVIPYYEKWMNKFPTVDALAGSDEHDVLNAWEGLGYYSRARNILKAARIIMERHHGKLPVQTKELRNLPGIGRYTAAAISSIAYGADEVVLDGNVKRVLARVHEFSEPVNTIQGEKKLWLIADSHLPHGKASEFNQAVMDLGATICTPRNPDCDHCPLNSICAAYKSRSQDQFPRMKEKTAIPHIDVCAAIIRQQELVLIAKRPSKGLLGGLWEFPGGKLENGERHEDALVREIQEELGVKICPKSMFGIYKHAYTHFKVTLQAWQVDLVELTPRAIEASEIRWVKVEDMNDFPMGKIDRAIANDLLRNF